MKPLFVLFLMATTSVFASSEIEGRYLKVGGENCYEKDIGIVLTDNKLQIVEFYQGRDGEEKSYVGEEFDHLNEGRQKKRINNRPKHASRMSYYEVVYSNYENILTEEAGTIRLKKRAKNRTHRYSEYMAPGENYFPNLGSWVARPFEVAGNLFDPEMEVETFELEYSGSTLEYKVTKNDQPEPHNHCIFEKKK